MNSDALAAWTPSLPVFLRRCLIVGVLTLLVVALAGWGIGTTTGYWQALYVGPVLALAYNIGFEDPARWRAARQNRWHLRSDALIHYGPDEETRIPLADITDVRKRLGWSVVVFLKGGMRVRIVYVRKPAEIVSQILAARTRLTP
ncbi:hypothetical protein [uncultured Sulfitobacter sp.]|uniref:hypothetical protein n=1 Tax=uncultured Sulfitobacter sp. TaxID=191468 RepID=UPI0026176894|nr:hypothetical protein [uncultured Sulfitobacter sp.]